MGCYDQTTIKPTLNHDRSIVGRPRHQGVMVGMGQKDSYVGLVVIDISYSVL